MEKKLAGVGQSLLAGTAKLRESTKSITEARLIQLGDQAIDVNLDNWSSRRV